MKFHSIPTLQELAHSKKMEFVHENHCLDCHSFKKSLMMCVWGEKLKHIGHLSNCPKN